MEYRLVCSSDRCLRLHKAPTLLGWAIPHGLIDRLPDQPHEFDTILDLFTYGNGVRTEVRRIA